MSFVWSLNMRKANEIYIYNTQQHSIIICVKGHHARTNVNNANDGIITAKYDELFIIHFIDFSLSSCMR